MEGLEISEINFFEIQSNKDKRIDPDYYSKSYIDALKIIARSENKFLSEIADTYELHSNGAFKDVYNYLHNYDDKSVRYIRSENIGNFFIEGPFDYISNHANHNLLKTQTQIGDILTARTGKVGGASIVTSKFVNCNTNQNVVNIRLFDIKNFSPFFVTIFLNTKYGIIQFEKSSTGNVQPWLNLSLLRKVIVPRLTMIFQKKIENLLIDSYDLKITSQQKYAEAEDLLLETLDLKDFQPSAELVNVKSFKDSYAITGRLDAEYYQAKYEETVEKIKEKQWKLLNQIVDISKSLEPGSSAYDEDSGLPFYRVSDYNKFGLSLPAKNLSHTYVTENKDLLNSLRPKKGTILFSKDGSVGTAYLLTADLNGITSGATLHLKTKEDVQVLPEYLTLALNSKLVQLQAERDAGGSIILHWRLDEIKKVVIPIIDYSIQQQIAKLIQESFILKSKSEKLLEVAKQAVEIAIEENEEIAMSYINENNI